MAGMQFPYPRNLSQSSVYASVRSSSYRNKRQLKKYGPSVLGLVALVWLLIYLFSGTAATVKRIPPGTPGVVIVTTLDPSMSNKFKDSIKENRRDYAQRHGYATFFPNTTDYDLMEKTPASWATIPGLRHAMTTYPHTPWLWYLSSTALIMNSKESLDQKLLDPRKLESLMITDTPVVPPDSVIKTLAQASGDQVDLILSQDREGLAGGSIFIRTGEWAKFFLDAWYDPLYRTYNFQKAEDHALEHIVQWHGTVLAKLALVPQRVLNSYTRNVQTTGEGVYQEGDFVANFHGCLLEDTRDCEKEMGPSMTRWRELRDQERRR